MVTGVGSGEMGVITVGDTGVVGMASVVVVVVTEVELVTALASEVGTEFVEVGGEFGGRSRGGSSS